MVKVKKNYYKAIISKGLKVNSITSQPYKTCTEYCEPHPDGYDFLIKVNETTTINDFKKLCCIYPRYEIKYCGLQMGPHALSRAASVGNVDLIYHIVMKMEGGRCLLNVGDGGSSLYGRTGWTPLYFATNCPNPKRGYKAAKALLTLGADPNIATNSNTILEKTYPPNSTPLYNVAERTKNLKLVKLLLLHNAAINPPLSPEGEAFIARAKLELAEKAKRVKALLSY